jgi:microspherule protein 1
LDVGLQVDVNLALEKPAAKVSRLQCLLDMDLEYGYVLRNIGRQTVIVNNVEVAQGSKVKVPHMSLIKIGTVQLLFLINIDAMQRACLQPPPCPKEMIV